MTRDEAKKIASANWPTNQFAAVQPLTPASFVALCEKLGMLKLEEPKSAWQKFADLMVEDFGCLKVEDASQGTLSSVKTALDQLGLKITAR